MRGFVGVLIAAAALGPAHAERVPSAGLGLVVRNVTVISPERATPLEHAYVRIADGRIADVSTRRLRGETEIDGTGAYLIPGLIDSHVHFQFGYPAGMTSKAASEHPKLAAAALAQDPRSYLYFGFTTIVALNASAKQTIAWNALDIRPDAYFCGGAPIANGYPMANLPPVIRYDFEPYFLYDPKQASELPSTIDPQEHGPERVVARMAADGAICVKTYYESGFAAQRNLPLPTVGMIQALVLSAHARGMPVFIHANSREAQAFAVAAGVDVIAHGMWNGWTMSRHKLPGDVETILDGVTAKGIGYQPTMQVVHAEKDLWDETYLSRPALAEAYSSALIDWYAGPDGGWLRDVIIKQDGKRPVSAQFDAPLARLDRVTSWLSRHNAKLLFGTDTPSGSSYTNPTGLNGRLEMDNWIAAGVSTTTLFRALTIDNARALHLEDKIGTVQPGKVANLLLLRTNPLKSVKAYDTIDTVFLHGRPIARATLSARNQIE